MAITGGRITASIYNQNGRDLPTAGVSGITNNFPNVGVMFYPAKAGTTANGVTMNAVIKVLPTGLVVDATTYLTDSTVAQLVTNGS